MNKIKLQKLKNGDADQHCILFTNQLYIQLKLSYTCST